MKWLLTLGGSYNANLLLMLSSCCVTWAGSAADCDSSLCFQELDFECWHIYVAFREAHDGHAELFPFGYLVKAFET